MEPPGNVPAGLFCYGRATQHAPSIDSMFACLPKSGVVPPLRCGLRAGCGVPSALRVPRWHSSALLMAIGASRECAMHSNHKELSVRDSVHTTNSNRYS